MNDPTLAFIFCFGMQRKKKLGMLIHSYLWFTRFWQASTCSHSRFSEKRQTGREWKHCSRMKQRKSDREGDRKKRGFGTKRTEGEGDLGAEEGKKEKDWGQKRGKERQGAFPHQIRSDRPNWGLCASGGRFRMRWWNFLNASFEKAQSSKFVFILPHQTD